MNIYLSAIVLIALPNKYTKWYCELVEKAIKRANTREEAEALLGYVEGHHIFPRSFEENNSPENFAFLSLREHFVAHRFLAKMFDAQFDYKMQKAIWKMAMMNPKRHHYTLISRTYESVKRIAVERIKGKSLIDLFGESKANEIVEKRNNTIRNKPIEEKEKLRKNKQNTWKDPVLLSRMRTKQQENIENKTEEEINATKLKRKSTWASMTCDQKQEIVKKRKITESYNPENLIQSHEKKKQTWDQKTKEEKDLIVQKRLFTESLKTPEARAESNRKRADASKRHDIKIHKFIHEIHGYRECTRTALIDEFTNELAYIDIWKITTGRAKIARGWRMVKLSL